MTFVLSKAAIAGEIDFQARRFGLPPVWAAAAVYGHEVQNSFLHQLPAIEIDSAIYDSREPFSKTASIGMMIHCTFMHKAGFGKEPMVRAALRTQELLSSLTIETDLGQPANLWQQRLNQLSAWENTDGERLKDLCFLVHAKHFEQSMRMVNGPRKRQGAARRIENLTFAALEIVAKENMKVKELVLIPSVAGYTATSVPVNATNFRDVNARIIKKPSVSAHL